MVLELVVSMVELGIGCVGILEEPRDKKKLFVSRKEKRKIFEEGKNIQYIRYSEYTKSPMGLKIDPI
jgi:hypothetical protein